MIITKYKQIRSDQKANTNTIPEMKISCNVKQGTSSVKNTSQTVQIKDKTNEKKPYLEQNISNHKLDGSDKKANTNTITRNENILQCETRHFFSKEHFTNSSNQRQNK